ncbi:MAG TPA: hypothetical protein VN030_14345 [Cellvibrio sp.]|nr:hypothetical protein [Cellvibrio sp.]
MNFSRILISFIFISSVSFADSDLKCNKKSVFDIEEKVVRDYLLKPSEIAHAVVCEDLFLPIPSRYSVFYEEGVGSSFSSAVVPIAYNYYGCKNNDHPRGMIEYGSISKCFYCDKDPSGSVKLLS